MSAPRSRARPAARERPLISPAVTSLARELYVKALFDREHRDPGMDVATESRERLADWALESARIFALSIKRRADQIRREKEPSA